MESHINKGLAYQLRAMREARDWSQEELATKVGMPQTAISRLESSNYGKPTITTLKRMARVYDVALEVLFVPFSKFVSRVSGTPYIELGLSSDALDVPSFDEEISRGALDRGLVYRKAPQHEKIADAADRAMAAAMRGGGLNVFPAPADKLMVMPILPNQRPDTPQLGGLNATQGGSNS